MQTRMLLKNTLVLTGIVLSSPNAIAEFATYAKNWPDDAATVNERISTPEPSKSTVFSQDSTTKNTACADTSDSNSGSFMNVPSRVDEMGRLYIKFGGILAESEVRHINNLSTGALIGTTLINNNISDNYLSWEFGLGAKTKFLRWELDYMYTKDLHYDPSPIFAGRSENLNGPVMNNTLWLNAYIDWDTDTFVYFNPYLGGMLGFVWNQTRSVMSGGVGANVAQYHSNYSVAWGVMLGARMPMWERWFGYFDWRYTAQGHVRWVDSTGQLQLKGNYMMSTFCLGVQYLLG